MVRVITIMKPEELLSSKLLLLLLGLSSNFLHRDAQDSPAREATRGWHALQRTRHGEHVHVRVRSTEHMGMAPPGQRYPKPAPHHAGRRHRRRWLPEQATTTRHPSDNCAGWNSTRMDCRPLSKSKTRTRFRRVSTTARAAGVEANPALGVWLPVGEREGEVIRVFFTSRRRVKTARWRRAVLKLRTRRISGGKAFGVRIADQGVCLRTVRKRSGGNTD
jgi:hypothetical protein